MHPEVEEARQEEAHQEAVLQEEVLQEEVHQEAVLQEEALQEEVHQEEAPQEEDPQEEGNHLHSKLKRHNQYPNKLDHAMNLFEEQKLRNSEETEPTPKNS